MNKILLIGNLGEDPEMRHGDGWSVASLNLATNEKYRDKNTGELKTITEWHRVEFWNKTALDIERYLRKGSRVYIEGRVKTDKYKDDKTGEDKYFKKIEGRVITYLDSRPKDEISPLDRELLNIIKSLDTEMIPKLKKMADDRNRKRRDEKKNDDVGVK